MTIFANNLIYIMEYNEKEVERLVKELKEKPNLFLYDYNLTDLVRYLLIKVEYLENKLNKK